MQSCKAALANPASQTRRANKHNSCLLWSLKTPLPTAPYFSNASCLCRALRDCLDACCSVAKSNPPALRGSEDWGEGGEANAAEKKTFCFLITNQTAWLTSKDKHTDGANRAWSGAGKSLAAVKQGKNHLARGKVAGRESSCNGAKCFLQLGYALLPPMLSTATSLFYILHTVLLLWHEETSQKQSQSSPVWGLSQAGKHELSRSTTKLRVQSMSLNTCACAHVYVRNHAHTVYTLYKYTHSKGWCLSSCVTSVQLYSCRTQQYTICMYASPFQPQHGCTCTCTHMMTQIPGQTPALHTLTCLGREYDSPQDAGHITLPSPGKNSHSAMGGQHKDCIGQNLFPLCLSPQYH